MKHQTSTKTNSTKRFFKLVKSGKLDDIHQFLDSLQCDTKCKDLLCHKYNGGDTILHYCVRFGHLHLIKYFHGRWELNLKVVNNDHKTLLHEAASFMMFDIVCYLLNHEIELDALKHSDWTPLMVACAKSNNINIVKKLVEAGADYNLRNKDGWTCFHIACRSCHTDSEIVMWLLSIDSTLWITKSNNLRTALHTACLNGNLEVVEGIISYCGDIVNAKDSCGNTALMDALRYGNAKIVDILMRSGSNLAARDHLGRHGLHICAEIGALSSIEILVEKYNVDVNTLTLPSNNRKGQTAMHCAYKEKQIMAVNCLTRLGADDQIVDWKGRMPTDMSV